MGEEGLFRLRTEGFDRRIFQVQPCSRQLKQTQVTKIKDDVRRHCTVTYQNLYADADFCRAAGLALEKDFPNLNARKGSKDRSWETILANGWENGVKPKVSRFPACLIYL